MVHKHKDLYWFRRNVPMSSGELLMFTCEVVCSRGYKQSREGVGSQVSMVLESSV
jgi:hypothetical protein